MNLRSGRLKTEMTDEAAEYTSSLEFDKIIFEADIKTNFAHTLMLKEENIIDDEIADNILGALDQLKEDGYNELVFDPSVEDIHMAIENYVTDKIGPTAGFMHTAKSVAVAKLVPANSKHLSSLNLTESNIFVTIDKVS